MLLDLSRLRGGTEHLERRFEPDAFAVEREDFRVVSPVDLVADVTKDGQKVRLAGRVATVLECACSRCLDPFAVPVDTRVELLFLPVGVSADEADRAVEEDDFGVSFYADQTIDLVEVVREQLYLALPMKPLCRPDCQGLCPVCGINRNRESCSCETAWEDPRLQVLKRFKSQ